MEERPSTGKTATSTSESGADSSKKKTSPLSSLEPFGRLRDPSCWWLPPVLLVTLLALFLAACGGIALSGLVFSGTVEAQDPCLSQSFVLFASILALPYVYLHVKSSIQNYSVLRSQSFQHPVHSWTTIAAWMDFVAWVPALISICVDVGRQAGEMTHLRLDLFVSALSFACTLIAVWTITKATDPFILPIISPISPLMSRANTLVGRKSAEKSTSRRGSSESRKNKRSPGGPRPLARTRRRLPLDDEEKGRSEIAASGGVGLGPTAESGGGGAGGVIDPKSGSRLSWGSVYQQQLEELERMSQRGPPSIYRRSDDWRRDWSNLEKDAGLRRDGSNLSTSTAGSLTFAAGATPGPSDQSGFSGLFTPHRDWNQPQGGSQPPRLPPHGGNNRINFSGIGPRRVSSGAARRPRLPAMPEEADGLSPTRDRCSLPRTDAYRAASASARLPGGSVGGGRDRNSEPWGFGLDPAITMSSGLGSARSVTTCQFNPVPSKPQGGNLPASTSYVKIPGAFVEEE